MEFIAPPITPSLPERTSSRSIGLLGGIVAMFLVSLLNYQALLEQVHWMYIAVDGVADRRHDFRPEIPGREALGENAEGESLPAFGVGQAHLDLGGGQILCRS